MKLTDAIKKFFRRRHADETAEQQPSATPQPLRIEGVKPAPLTAEPDDAELAAQALLESMAAPQPPKGGAVAAETPPSGGRGASYYRALADRIRSARTAEARLVMRLLTAVEEQLAKPAALYKGQWGDTERKLYRAMDVAEREGGELHRRWQHCLANVLVRRIEEEREAMEDGRRKMEDGSGDGTQVAHLRDAATDNDSANPANSEPSNPANSEPSNPANSGAANPANSGAAGGNDNSSQKV